jgi:TIR domain
MSRPRAWVLVTGAALSLSDVERIAAWDLGRLLAREGYGLIAGTWGGTDHLVTEAFVSTCDRDCLAESVIHVENHPPHSKHSIRVGRVIQSSPGEAYSREAVEWADVGVVVSGRKGSKPTMDALSLRRKPVLPLAWLGNDALECLFDVLREAHGDHARRRFLLPLIDPASGRDESLSRALGAYTCRREEVFVSYHREDTGADAGRLGAALAERYGSNRVFLDYISFPAAEELDGIMSKARSSRLLIVFVGAKWIDKVASEADYVRRELLAGKAGGSTIAPVFLAGVPDIAAVPEPLRFIHDLAGLSFDRTRWSDTLLHCERLVDRALGVTAMQQQVLP